MTEILLTISLLLNGFCIWLYFNNLQTLMSYKIDADYKISVLNGAINELNKYCLKVPDQNKVMHIPQELSEKVECFNKNGVFSVKKFNILAIRE